LLCCTLLCCTSLCRRFGAEDLFKAAEEGSAERSKRLLEEDIDAILQRAEVVEQGPGAVDAPANGVAAELLSSFNVATFKVCAMSSTCSITELVAAGSKGQQAELECCKKLALRTAVHNRTVGCLCRQLSNA
jgi:hypothetical protein